MEAAINNAAVVYHSDPRLILVVLRCQQSGVSSTLSFLRGAINRLLDPTTLRSLKRTNGFVKHRLVPRSCHRVVPCNAFP